MMTEKRKQLCGYISIATLSTRFFSENCLQTPLSLNTKNNLQYFRSLFWKKLIENNKESYCRPTKLTPKIWVPNSKKKTSQKITGKKKSSIGIHPRNCFRGYKVLPESKMLHLKPGPPDAQFNKDFTKSWWKENQIWRRNGETIKWARATKTLVTFHSTDCFRRTLLIVYYNLHNAAKWSKNLTMSV